MHADSMNSTFEETYTNRRSVKEVGGDVAGAPTLTDLRRRAGPGTHRTLETHDGVKVVLRSSLSPLILQLIGDR